MLVNSFDPDYSIVCIFEAQNIKTNIYCQEKKIVKISF